MSTPPAVGACPQTHDRFSRIQLEAWIYHFIVVVGMLVEHLPLQTFNLGEKCSFLPLIVSGDVACHVLFVRAPDSLTQQTLFSIAVIMQFIASSLSTCFCSNHRQKISIANKAFRLCLCYYSSSFCLLAVGKYSIVFSTVCHP